jgi:hypothetical protein
MQRRNLSAGDFQRSALKSHLDMTPLGESKQKYKLSVIGIVLKILVAICLSGKQRLPKVARKIENQSLGLS